MLEPNDPRFSRLERQILKSYDLTEHYQFVTLSIINYRVGVLSF